MSNPNKSKVGIVVINLNSYDDTTRCLHSLQGISYRDTELILIDNGSNDGSGERLKTEFEPDVFIATHENIGSTGARNLGMKQALNDNCDYVLLLDDDSIVTPSFLSPLVAKLDAAPIIAAVSGKIYASVENKGKENIIWFAGSERKWHTWFNHRGMNDEDYGQYEKGTFIDAMPACLMLIRSEALRKFGLFSDDYFVYWEEADWCARVMAGGYHCYYEPQSTIVHNFQSNIPGHETTFYNYLQYRNAFIFNSRHNSFLKSVQFALTLPLLFIHRTVRSLKAKNYAGVMASVWGILDYFRGCRGKQGLVERGILKK